MTTIGVPPSQADELLGESYKLNQHTSTNQSVLHIVGYSLPAALHACANRRAAAALRVAVHAAQMPRKRSWEEAAAMANASATSGGEPVTVLSKTLQFCLFPEILRWPYRTDQQCAHRDGRECAQDRELSESVHEHGGS